MKLKPITIELEEKQLEELDNYCKKTMIPRTRIIRKAISEYLKMIKEIKGNETSKNNSS